MKDMFKNFIKNLKEYVDIILKLNFGELFVYSLELILIVLLSLLMYIPVGLIEDLVRTVCLAIIPDVEVVLTIINIVFKLISLGIFVIVFIYLFNGRYNDLKKDIKEKKEKSSKKEENIELPSIKK
ncbi:MAG: hypothetical protein ACI4WW_08270 [Candidatus Coprovivens sp.]